MVGSRMPIVVSHGEGRAVFRDDAARPSAQAALRYIDHRGAPALGYPFNPNGSPAGLTGFTTPDGRFTIMMPHPERTARTLQMSWAPRWLLDASPDASPWQRMFGNARKWLE
jgi:phosphoribosylformylglycinamidine synthase